VRILVTGRTGQLASSLLEAGAGRGCDIVAVGRPDLDLADRASVEAAVARLRPDVVINAAAYTGVDTAETESERAYAINATGAGHVAQACARREIPVIHISTDYVFDGTKPGPYNEDDPASPIGVYGLSKLSGEQRVIAANRSHVILRTSWLFSPFGANFVKTMLRLAGTRTEIGVVDDQVGCPTYAPHLAECVLTIAARITGEEGRRDAFGVYHAAGSGAASWCEFAREVFRCSSELGGPAATAKPIATADYPLAARRPANSRLDCSKLAREFGLALPPWSVGVRDCVVRLLAAGTPIR
jgi:dTDP-4-dehydrorhamnose reductase